MNNYKLRTNTSSYEYSLKNFSLFLMDEIKIIILRYKTFYIIQQNMHNKIKGNADKRILINVYLKIIINYRILNIIF